MTGMTGPEKLMHESALRWRVDLDGFDPAEVLQMRQMLGGLYDMNAEAEGEWVRWAIEKCGSSEEVLGMLRNKVGL